MTKQADVFAYIFEGKGHILSGEMLLWMDDSARFTAFVETYRDKIRKKLRVTKDLESILDLRSELEVGYHLLEDRKLEVVYEPYASAKRRGPDYAVTYRANLVFNVEVSRLHGEGADPAVLYNRILRILMAKLGQMQPGMPNLLAVHAQTETARQIDLSGLMRELKIKIERKASIFYGSPRTEEPLNRPVYKNPADFYKDFLHLSGILLWAGEQSSGWINKQAKPALSEKVWRRLYDAARGRMGTGD
jgi:hypothetical protein